jgi:uncharacterized repeat protein (TIGR02543 family)
MKKFAEEAFKVFWIPVIMAVVSYIFFTLKDVTLGIIVLVALSAAYTLIRLYFTYKKWWLLIILVVVLGVSGGAYFLKAPTISLMINGEKITAAETDIGGATIMVSPTPMNGLYAKGTVVTLTATAGAGQDWASWVGTNNDNTNPTTVKMDNAKQIRVNFESRYSLVINNEMVIGNFLSFLEGDIAVSPAPDNDNKYTSGTIVTLSVRSNTGYDWISWTGTDSDLTNPATVIMSGGNKNVSVNFEGRFTLILENHLVIGPMLYLEEGSINIDPAPGPDDKFAYGTKITLTANPETGYGWKSWTGTGNDDTNPVIITINSEKHIEVNFEERYLVMVNNQALSSSTIDLTGGSVSATPGPGDDLRFTKNSLATFTAEAAAGYRFDSWSGDVSDTSTSISMMLDENKSITALFIKIFDLTASASEGGTVSPAEGTYDTGSLVTVTAAPNAGYRFDKWSGDASGNSPILSVLIDANKALRAEFIRTYLLTITNSPADGGTVTPGSGTYDTDTLLTLIAVPADGYDFSGWEGDVSGNVTSANVTMTKDTNVTAIFIPEP